MSGVHCVLYLDIFCVGGLCVAVGITQILSSKLIEEHVEMLYYAHWFELPSFIPKDNRK